MENITQVLVLYDCKHGPVFVSKFEYVGSKMEMIKKLAEPHARIYHFRSIYLDDIDEYEIENAWYEVNTAFIPQPFDLRRPQFLAAFELLWKQGGEI